MDQSKRIRENQMKTGTLQFGFKAVLISLFVASVSLAVLPQPRHTSGTLPGHSHGILTIAVPGVGHAGDAARLRIWVRDERLGDAVWVFSGDTPVPNDLVTFNVSNNEGTLEGQFTFEADDYYHSVEFTTPTSPALGQGSAIAKTVRLRRDDTSTVETSSEASFQPTESLKNSQTALAEDVSWPNWYGPHFTMRDQVTESEIVTSWEDVIPVWRSEEVTPAGLGSISRQGHDAHEHQIGGGSASLVSAYGNVYLFHHDPAGTVYDTTIISSIDSILEWYETNYGSEAAQQERDRWLISADDVILCIDGETGSTKWRTVFQEKGVNWQGHKGGYNNLTPSVGDGKVFALGSTYRVYCLDAATGDSLWESDLGSAHENFESRKQKFLQEMELGDPFFATGRTVRGAGVYADGKYLAHDYNGGIRAFDAATGTVAWETGDFEMPEATPAIWSNGENSYVLACGKDKVHCFSAADGTEKWTADCPGATGNGISVAEGYMAILTYIKERTPSQEHLVWFELGVDGALKKGEIARPETASEFIPPIVNGHMYYGSRDTTRVVNLETGDIIGEISGYHYGIARAGHYQVMQDRLFIQHDGRHGFSRMVMAKLDPNDFEVITPEEWNPPHWTTSAYVNGEIHPLVDGRMFLRGSDGVYCYDFRTESSSAFGNTRIGNTGTGLSPTVRSLPGGKLRIQSGLSVTWTLTNIAGQTIRKGNGRGVLDISTHNLSAGCYILQLRDPKTANAIGRYRFVEK